MKAKFILTLTVIVCSFTSLYSQGFTPPAEGKAVVYFVRVTSMGFAISFEYFDNDKYIGVFKGKNYMRYECEAGTKLLWASTENKEFLTAELAPGGTYVVIVDVAMGMAKARVGLSPITDKDAELFERAKKLVMAEPPVVTSEEKISEMNVKLKNFIQGKLQKYETEWKKEKNFKHISADMAISPSALQ